jgi:O-antigen/teichoic acid export membrane protein
LLTIAGSALYSVSLAELSTAAGSGLEKVMEVSQTTFRYVFLVYIPISVAMSIFAIPIISILFTEAYFESYIVVMLIGFTRSLFCYDFVANGFLLAVDKPRSLLEAGILASIIQVIPALLLIEPLEILGATVSRCIMTSVLALYPLIVVRKKYGFVPDFRFQSKTLISAYFPVIPSFILLSYGNLNQYVALPLAAFIYGWLFLIGLRVQSTIKQDEVETLAHLFPKKLQRPISKLLVKLVVNSKKLENN